MQEVFRCAAFHTECRIYQCCAEHVGRVAASRSPNLVGKYITSPTSPHPLSAEQQATEPRLRQILIRNIISIQESRRTPPGCRPASKQPKPCSALRRSEQCPVNFQPPQLPNITPLMTGWPADSDKRPPYSTMQLIQWAIMQSVNRRLHPAEMRDWITDCLAFHRSSLDITFAGITAILSTAIFTFCRCSSSWKHELPGWSIQYDEQQEVCKGARQLLE